ncbi:coiled-coil domain-containing protein 97 [Dunckerocampus dactyliophorus]|uniref:coiled-coil domain-containing protein 97 n=1 Tax=Dunckerocampus dactyliophorus TaxID=161453 RepID=UPI002406472E|nr:coiled-coil domain-containing protein 97 [Dunckerocampus dactyliophorus]
MWGELEPRVKIQPNTSDTSDLQDDRSTLPEKPVEIKLLVPPIVQQEPLEDTQNVPADITALLDAVVVSGSKVKSQQIGEAELTPEERKKELLQQYRSKPLVFLERYHGYLKPEHLRSFAHVSADPRTQHYSKVIHRRAAGSTDKKRIRNQRYAALRALQKEGEYFSEEQMRMREPLLYEQYIGQYLTDEEVLERSQEAMLHSAQGGPEAQQGAPGGLAHLLLNSYQERLIQGRLQEEQEREEDAQEEDEDDEDDGVQEKTWEPTSEEKALLREEFISQMHQRFLDGKDKDFNYSEVDENPDFDNLDIVSRDAEEKYFDEDDEGEDEDVMTE